MKSTNAALTRARDTHHGFKERAVMRAKRRRFIAARPWMRTEDAVKGVIVINRS